jgi:hypothetical protein
MESTFPFTLENVQIECGWCGHQLVGHGDFGLELVRCTNCRRFNQIISRVEVVKVKTPVPVPKGE